MANQTKPDGYITTIGIECHVQLKTHTKLFAGVLNDAREAPPNTLISHICLGMPGALPVLNQEAVHLAVRVAFAFGIEPQRHSIFERKHYFYPDLPKGYQITQLSEPIINGGQVTFNADGKTNTVRVNRVQIEEDAGKNIHPTGKDYSLVDLNRAGTPLLEIVSEPDIHSAAEAKAYAKELYLLMRYADVSDANLFYGNMRFDVNVSLSKDSDKLGTRTETKNLNSFRSVEKAVEYEVKRQTGLLEKGGKIVQETRGWDDAKQKTFSQRSKEEAHDYRYMPEPDIPPIELSDAYIKKVKAEMPAMPPEWRSRLEKLGLDKQQVDTLIEAEVEDGQSRYLELIEKSLDEPVLAKALANWFVNIEIPFRRDNEKVEELTDVQRYEAYKAIHELVEADKLSSTNAKALISTLLETGVSPPSMEKYAEEQGFIQQSNKKELSRIVEKVIENNPKAADDVKKSETKAIGFLVGQVMRASQGKANPQVAQQLLKEQLSKP